MPDDLSHQSLRELLAIHVAVLEEIQARGLSRTRGSLVGELAEHIAVTAYGGELVTAGLKSTDLIDGCGRTIQVKARALKPGVNRIYAFSSFDFEILVAVMFDLDTFEIQWARELTSADASEIARFRVPSNDYAIATGKVKRAGIDITAKLRAAYTLMDGEQGTLV